MSQTGGLSRPGCKRDIGVAYLVCGGALIWLVLGRAGGSAAALTGGAFLLLHGLVHLWDTVAGRATLEHLAQDFLAVLSEDCGPCTQLGVTMAERDGVSAAMLRAVIEGDEEAMGAVFITLGLRLAAMKSEEGRMTGIEPISSC